MDNIPMPEPVSPEDYMKAEEIDGWMRPAELQYLAETAKKSKLILEVGSYKGRSSRAIADNTAGKLYCCDPWTGNYLFDDGRDTGINCNVYEQFRNNLYDHIQNSRVFTIRGKFLEVIWPEKFKPDFIFLDGDHRYETLKEEIKLARKIMADGGILAGHDYGDEFWPGVKRAVDELIPQIDLVNTIWIQK